MVLHAAEDGRGNSEVVAKGGENSGNGFVKVEKHAWTRKAGGE